MVIDAAAILDWMRTIDPETREARARECALTHDREDISASERFESSTHHQENPTRGHAW
jgi:hypothetical protein